MVYDEDYSDLHYIAFEPRLIVGKGKKPVHVYKKDTHPGSAAFGLS